MDNRSAENGGQTRPLKLAISVSGGTSCLSILHRYLMHATTKPKQHIYRLLTLSKWLILLSGFSLMIHPASAQIIPDNTLPNNSRVAGQGRNRIISGGTTAGNNLFHSFQEFSVLTGSSAHFNNANNIENIITRVTGGSVSNIDGLIKANGDANFFLINPAGIIFGRNAKLDIGGSFVASTASSLKFADGSTFAIGEQIKPLMTVTAPVGLQYGINPPVRIQVQGNGQGIRLANSPIIDTENGLRVKPDKTLALVGGDIYLEGGTLKTAGGRIELGSVGTMSFVSLTPDSKGFALGYDGVQNFGNIELLQQTVVDASGKDAGDVVVTGKYLTLSGGSRIETSALDFQSRRDIFLRYINTINIRNLYTNAFLNSDFGAIADPQSVIRDVNAFINTIDSILGDIAKIASNTQSAAKGGNLTVNAQEVRLIGTQANGGFSSGLYASVEKNSTGAAGNVTINTGKLVVRDGALVTTSTDSTEKGGNLTVNAQDVQLIGTNSGLYASANPNSIAGAGKVTINTNKLVVQDGALISTSTFSSGKGGNLTVNAQDVQLIGTSANGQTPSGLYTSAEQTSIGAAGDLTISTDKLLVRDGAQVAASTDGVGKGGNLTVKAQDVQLIGASANGQFASGLYPTFRTLTVTSSLVLN